MGAVAGIITPDGTEATDLVKMMLTSLEHRGRQRSIWNAESSGENRSVAIGACNHESVGNNIASQNDRGIAIDGSLYEMKQEQLAKKILGHISRNGLAQDSMRLLVRRPGGFAMVFHSNRMIGALRDLNGFKPLYAGEIHEATGFASERKALWKVGCKNVSRILPGRLYYVRKRKIQSTRLAAIRNRGECQMTMDQAAGRLSSLLRTSVRKITRGTERIGVAFSGGLDSSLTALMAKPHRPEIKLFSIGLEGSVELTGVERCARMLDLPIEIEPHNRDELEGYVRRLTWLIEESNLMKVSIAIPLYWAAQLASKSGIKILLCGQGSDELYGGYYKYSKVLDSNGRAALRAALRSSVLKSYEVNFERDDQTCSPFNIELRTPFANVDVIEFSLAIPSELKVRKGNDIMRKWVLRNLAKRLGLPEELAWRRKKAIQHGSGVEVGIRKLAKQSGLSAEAYLQKIHAEVINMDSMP